VVVGSGLGASTSSLFIGIGDGTFRAAQAVAAGNTVQGLAVDDVR
jgi:hypothetical protein